MDRASGFKQEVVWKYENLYSVIWPAGTTKVRRKKTENDN